jgi:hypothetical protein
MQIPGYKIKMRVEDMSCVTHNVNLQYIMQLFRISKVGTGLQKQYCYSDVALILYL